MSENTVRSALIRLGYSGEEQTAHGFRAMASTILNEQGFHRDAIERQLAQGERNRVRAAYNHAEHLPERRRGKRIAAFEAAFRTVFRWSFLVYLLAVAYIAFFLRRSRKLSGERFLRGAVKVPFETLRAGLKGTVEADDGPGAFNLEICGLDFPRDSETKHVYAKIVFTPPKEAVADPFWLNAAKDVFVAGLRFLHLSSRRANADIWDFFCQDLPAIAHLLQSLPLHHRMALKHIDTHNKGPGASVISVLTEKISFYNCVIKASGHGISEGVIPRTFYDPVTPHFLDRYAGQSSEDASPPVGSGETTRLIGEPESEETGSIPLEGEKSNLMF